MTNTYIVHSTSLLDYCVRRQCELLCHSCKYSALLHSYCLCKQMMKVKFKQMCQSSYFVYIWQTVPLLQLQWGCSTDLGVFLCLFRYGKTKFLILFYYHVLMSSAKWHSAPLSMFMFFSCFFVFLPGPSFKVPEFVSPHVCPPGLGYEKNAYIAILHVSSAFPPHKKLEPQQFLF